MLSRLLLLSVVACTLLVGALGSTDCTIKTLTIKDQKGRSVSLAQTWNSAIFTGWTSEVANDVESITVASTRPGSGAYVYTYSSSFGSGASTARGQKATDVASSTIPLEVTQGTSCNYVQIVVTCSCKNTYLLKFCRKPPSGTKGDPIFSGLLGQEFQIHGVANEVYNVISDPVMQMNSRFVFLDHGACPILNGRRAHACWSHPGSYLGEIGIKTNGGDRVHISSGSARHGFKRITLNGRDLEYDEVMPIASDNSVWNNQSSTDLLRSDDSYDNLMDSWIVRNSTHLVTVQLSNYIFQIENSDHFLNYRVKVTNWSNLPGTHGLLGQTYQKPSRPGRQVKEIEGAVDDYQIGSHSLWGDDFTFNQFGIEDVTLQDPQGNDQAAF